MSDKNNIDLSDIAGNGVEYTHPMYYSHTKYRLTKLSFVKLWQTSASMDEFMLRVRKINETRKSENCSPITEKSHIYTRRANIFRKKKDVPMKKLEWENPEGPDSEWAKIRALAEQLA